MLRRISSVFFTQLRGHKDDITVKWVRPPYLPAYHPQKSGDLEPAPPVPGDTIGLEYRDAEELKDAPESVRKIFSVSYLGGREKTLVIRRELMDRVKRHAYDKGSAESRIAKLTASIRGVQIHMEKFPRDVRSKVFVQELIDKRKQLLKFLRRYDYKKFEWLLEKLNIEYKASPDSFHKLTRKESLRKLTELYCEEIRTKKLTDYRHLLESQQGPFLKNKLADLKLIRSEQEALKLPITVTMQDIKKVEVALEKWQVTDDIKNAATKKKKKSF